MTNRAEREQAYQAHRDRKNKQLRARSARVPKTECATCHEEFSPPFSDQYTRYCSTTCATKGLTP